MSDLVQEVLRLTPVYEQVEDGWTQARLVELPGVITAAPSPEQAQDQLVDALREFLLSFAPDQLAAEASPHSVEPALRLTITTSGH